MKIRQDYQMTLLVSVSDVSFYRHHRFVETSFEKSRDRSVKVRFHALKKVTLVSVKLKTK
jgi:hypothetical protein